MRTTAKDSPGHVLKMPKRQAIRTDLCILVCLYSISGQHIEFFDFQTNRSLQCMKTEVRLHRESCFHVALEVLLMKLLAYRIYLPIEERINFMALKRSTAEGWQCIASEKNVITFTDRSAIGPGAVITRRRGCSDPLIPIITYKSNLISMLEISTHVPISWSGQLDTRSWE